jgi:hypothetical protein
MVKETDSLGPGIGEWISRDRMHLSRAMPTQDEMASHHSTRHHPLDISTPWGSYRSVASMSIFGPDRTMCRYPHSRQQLGSDADRITKWDDVQLLINTDTPAEGELLEDKV